MKIERNLLTRMTIEEFAEKHDLTMSVYERTGPILPRFYAYFRGAEVKEGDILIGISGDGDSEEEAIKDYAKQISTRRLVLGAYTPERREIDVPKLFYEAPCS